MEKKNNKIIKIIYNTIIVFLPFNEMFLLAFSLIIARIPECMTTEIVFYEGISVKRGRY